MDTKIPRLGMWVRLISPWEKPLQHEGKLARVLSFLNPEMDKGKPILFARVPSVAAGPQTRLGGWLVDIGQKRPLVTLESWLWPAFPLKGEWWEQSPCGRVVNGFTHRGWTEPAITRWKFSGELQAKISPAFESRIICGCLRPFNWGFGAPNVGRPMGRR